MLRRFVLVSFAAVGLLACRLRAADLAANNNQQFQAALRAAKPGDHIRLGPGPFKGGLYAEKVAGTEKQPIRISGPSAQQPAVFQAEEGSVMQLPRSSYVEVENLHITRAKGSALMFDDGGKNDYGCHHITIQHCTLEDVGPDGTACSIKLAGVSDFVVRDCTFRAWGISGDAIDGVGCKQGLVEGCKMLAGRGGPGVQFKGGSEAVVIRGCFFEDATDVGINVGGSSGLAFFRPKPQGYEARNITVEGNIFVGGRAALTFGSIDGSIARFNTIYLPKSWAFRILQMNNAPDFVPCRNGRFEDNLVVFKSTQWNEGGINIGPKTAPETFQFARNAWYCVDAPGRSTPKLPSKETEALIGQNPEMVNPEKGDFSLRANSPARGKGASALKAPGK